MSIAGEDVILSRRLVFLARDLRKRGRVDVTAEVNPYQRGVLVTWRTPVSRGRMFFTAQPLNP